MTSRPRDVQVLPIEGALVFRSRSWNRLRFEIEYALEKGTTANSYLIQSEQAALIDPPGGTFTEIFVQALQERIDLSKLQFVICQHINPNRVQTLHRLMQIAPHLCFVGSVLGIRNLHSILEANFPDTKPHATLIIRGEEALNLGSDYALQFLLTPTPRYPDSICTYDPQSQILYTDKFFGAHLCGDQVFDEGSEAFQLDRRYYFDCLMANQCRQVESALDKIEKLPAQLYAPNHGILVRYSRQALLTNYRQWCKEQQQQPITVALLYASAYGNTAIMAQTLARGITKASIGVESLNCEQASPAEIKQAVEKASGILVGSPTLGGHLPTQMQTALGIILAHAPKSCLTGVFGSYGWSGEAVDIISDKLKEAGYAQGFAPIKIKFTPTESILQFCEETGTAFAQALKRAKKVPMTLVPGSSVEQAVGRLVGSLCVVTVQKGDIRTAMLASWVSQASFNPPGLTVAVAKDRAIESYLYLGDRFVLNILPQGSNIAKQFMKKFNPGADRFAQIATELTDRGGIILSSALAYIECVVSQRMETGDHWLVYGTATAGKVLLPNELTAVHHRKSGGHY
jgi:flavorubredoxin/flavin reductase (DIM6/NTAB) family NADH-FMN oxidoreductase RutF